MTKTKTAVATLLLLASTGCLARVYGPGQDERGGRQERGGEHERGHGDGHGDGRGDDDHHEH
jgi:hypothetical protein